MVENYCFVKGKEVDLEYCYYISFKVFIGEEVVIVVWEYWGIELMYWVFDVSMNEDVC